MLLLISNWISETERPWQASTADIWRFLQPQNCINPEEVGTVLMPLLAHKKAVKFRFWLPLFSILQDIADLFSIWVSFWSWAKRQLNYTHIFQIITIFCLSKLPDIRSVDYKEGNIPESRHRFYTNGLNSIIYLRVFQRGFCTYVRVLSIYLLLVELEGESDSLYCTDCLVLSILTLQ